MKNYDLIVVGAGIVGLAHAYTAASRGQSVLVIERDAACLGASIRNFGFVTITGQRAGAHWQRAMRSRQVWAEVAPQAGIDVVHSGLWLTARRPAAAAVLEAFMQTEMGEGCALLTPEQAAARHPALRTDGLQSVLYSPHELRVESRTAIPQLALWLQNALGVDFRFSETVTEVATPRVTTSRATYHAERVVVCNNADPGGLFAGEWKNHQVQLCQLQMLRVKPQTGFKLEGSVMGDLSLIRYEGYSALPQAAALRAELERDEAESLANGIHLIAVQSADGSLVVGDSHHYGSAPQPFASEAVNQLMLRHMNEALHIENAQVVERWTGIYPSCGEAPAFVKAPDDATRVVAVTSGSGASTAFGLAEEVWKNW